MTWERAMIVPHRGSETQLRRGEAATWGPRPIEWEGRLMPRDRGRGPPGRDGGPIEYATRALTD
jgi:hypothetical protein